MTALLCSKWEKGKQMPPQEAVHYLGPNSVSQMGNREEILWNWNRTDFPDLSGYVG